MEINRLYGHIETIFRMESMGNILFILGIKLTNDSFFYIKYLFGSISLLEQETIFLVLPMLKECIEEFERLIIYLGLLVYIIYQVHSAKIRIYICLLLILLCKKIKKSLIFAIQFFCMRKLFYSGIFLLLAACNSGKEAVMTYSSIKEKSNDFLLSGKLFSCLYHQQAAEYDALCYQAYNLARLRLDEALSKKGDKPLAIISDIDETFLNTSYYVVGMTEKGIDHSKESWEEWTAKGEATPLAGALDFFQYADSKGVAIFYVTNRYTNEKEGTIKNLKAYGFPIQEANRLVFRSGERSKESRRLEIAKNYDIVLFLGDNLADFDKDFDVHSTTERAEATAKNQQNFGKKYIVLPNTFYGEWENVLYDNKNPSLKERKNAILKRLKNKPAQ